MTALKTVKYFRDLGLELVADDMISSQTSVEHSPACLLGECVPNGCEPNLSARDAWVIRGFAWRENAGEKPSFAGEVEWSMGGVHASKISMTKLLWCSVILRWRPLLSQQDELAPIKDDAKTVIDWSKVPEGCNFALQDKVNTDRFDYFTKKPEFKGAQDFEPEGDHLKYSNHNWTLLERPNKPPIYTQEMADNGVLPVLGMDVELVIFENLTSCGHIEYKNKIGFLFRYKENNLCDFVEFSGDVAFKPLTPRELAIADLVKVLEEAAKHGEDYVIDAAAIYDAGYRKQ